MKNLFTLILDDMILFPEMTVEYPLIDETDIKTAEKALKSGKDTEIAIVYDRIEGENSKDGMGTIALKAKIKQLREIEGHTNILVECVSRIVFTGIKESDGIRTCYTEDIDENLPEEIADSNMTKGFVSALKDAFMDYCHFDNHIPKEIISIVRRTNDLCKLCDIISPICEGDYEEQYEIFATINPAERAVMLTEALRDLKEIASIAQMIEDKTRRRMDGEQHDYYLRMQLETLNEELYGTTDEEDECVKFGRLIDESGMPEDGKDKLRQELHRLKLVPLTSPEANVIRTYLEYCLKLPWNKKSKESKSIAKARKVLDKEHYGLTDVKERIIEMIAARMCSDEIRGQILCFVGPPGIGKTSIVHSIAEATGRSYQRIALGGVRDEAEIRGHRRTYIGAVPGRIVNALIDSRSDNPVILLDEIDKLASDYRGDPAAALLEVLDPEQNSEFTDHFIDIPFDLSNVLFVTTANDASEIPAPLLDRMDIIELNSYTAEEKLNIAKKHLIPKQMKQHNLTSAKLKIADNAIKLMISGYTREAGVRQLERLIAKLCRKTILRLMETESEVVKITNKNLGEFLGAEKFKDNEELTNEVGLVNGLAWTSVGGELLQVETAVVDGSGKLELTGSLGDVMKESAKAAITYVRSRADVLGIDKNFAKDKDIHIHVPEGAVPKDGPSAGVTITTSLVSALTGRKVSGAVAMTGEVTLRGRVLPIGGLREKSMAAFKHGVGTVIIPKGNEPDLEKIDDAVKSKVKFVPVNNVDEVLDIALM